MRVLGLVLLRLLAAQPSPLYDAVPMEVRVPLDVGDCVRAVKSIDYEDLSGNSKIVDKNAKGTLVHVASDHVVVKWNRQPSLKRAAAFPHQVRRAQWPKGIIAAIDHFSDQGDYTKFQEKDSGYENAPVMCLTVVEYHGFPPMIKPKKCVKNWKNQQFTTALTCRPGQIYWVGDPTLCIDSVHPELVQLRDCNGAESQMFALADPPGPLPEITNEGFWIGTGPTQDKCFTLAPDSGADSLDILKHVQFGDCDFENAKNIQFRYTDFQQDSE
jgi:hypothetical protein